MLSQHVSAILLDPEYGLGATRLRDAKCGLLLAYESDGFENPRPIRMLVLAPGISVRKLRDLDADAVKVLLSYDPTDNPQANEEKHSHIERIGHECESLDMPFFLEPLVYNAAGPDPQNLEFAQHKPAKVVRTVEEFSKPVYRVDILKIDFPVNVSFVEGCAGYTGGCAQSRGRPWNGSALPTRPPGFLIFI